MYFPAREHHRQYVAITSVALIHAGVIWMFATETMRFARSPLAIPELHVIIFNPELAPAPPSAPPSSYTFKLPEEVDVPEPQIAITAAVGIGKDTRQNQLTERLAPTLDPSHVNDRPELPGKFKALIAALALKMDILVQPNGSVFDVHIVRSTGDAEIDRLATTWVKTNWQFLPALQNGQPIQSWTTVMVRFAPIH